MSDCDARFAASEEGWEGNEACLKRKCPDNSGYGSKGKLLKKTMAAVEAAMAGDHANPVSLFRFSCFTFMIIRIFEQLANLTS